MAQCHGGLLSNGEFNCGDPGLPTGVLSKTNSSKYVAAEPNSRVSGPVYHLVTVFAPMS